MIAHAAEQRFEICPAATGTGTSRKLASLRLGVMAEQGNRSELSVVSVAEFEVEERRGDIIVKAAGFLAVYFKPSNKPQLVLKRRSETDDHELLARAWQAANTKARELGWIV